MVINLFQYHFLFLLPLIRLFDGIASHFALQAIFSVHLEKTTYMYVQYLVVSRLSVGERVLLLGVLYPYNEGHSELMLAKPSAPLTSKVAR